MADNNGNTTHKQWTHGVVSDESTPTFFKTLPVSNNERKTDIC